MNNHYAKFEYKGINSVGVTDYTNRHPLSIWNEEKMSKFNSLKIKRIFSNVIKIEGAHVQCMNNHYAKFEY